MSRWPNKDPDDILDYGVDWSARLSGDTLAASDWIVPDGITEDSASFSASSATIWLSGGTAGQSYAITNRVTTAAGRQFDATVTIQVVES